jgi:hypothetical protein
MNKKKLLGQFFTKNSDYILKNLEPYVYKQSVIDIFCGNKDLLNWAIKHGANKVLGYDIDKTLIDNKTIFYQDSLNNPQETIFNSFILTNPPYLNINQSNKNYEKLFNKNPNCKDLYHIALKNILSSDMGILILPINFLISHQANFIRTLFFQKFQIITCNYFSNQVFNKTKTNIISFYYKRATSPSENTFNLTLYPTNEVIKITLSNLYNYQLGGKNLTKFYSQKIFNKVRYLSPKDIQKGDIPINLAFENIKNSRITHINPTTYNLIQNNIILFSAISTKSNLKNHNFLTKITTQNIEGLIGNNNSRNQIHLIFQHPISINIQEELIFLVNQEINNLQKSYHNLIFVNYRDNNRKRISFQLINQILNYFLYQIQITKSAKVDT